MTNRLGNAGRFSTRLNVALQVEILIETVPWVLDEVWPLGCYAPAIVYMELRGSLLRNLSVYGFMRIGISNDPCGPRLPTTCCA